MGWLHSRPKQGKNDDRPKARLELYPSDDPILSPPVPHAVIVSAFFDCGMASNSGMGRSALTWQEVKAYSELSEIGLDGWEAKQVIIMSRTYCNMISEATETRQIKAPYTPELTEKHIYNRGAHASRQADEKLDIRNY